MFKVDLNSGSKKLGMRQLNFSCDVALKSFICRDTGSNRIVCWSSIHDSHEHKFRIRWP